jgi:DHA1 family tetracycline resistance protein-like MFS transporter
MSEVISDSENSGEVKTRRISSLKIFLFCFWLYSVSFTISLPAFPSLLLQVTGGDNDLASRYYGWASSIRYSLEFFSNPYLGNLSDTIGRKKVLILSLVIVCLEFFSLALFPSVTTIFVTAVLSGLGNSSIAMGYAIITDIANTENQSVTSYFGYFGAIFGLGFIIGPLLGSFLISVSVRACFFVSAFTCLIALFVAVFLFEESLSSFKVYIYICIYMFIHTCIYIYK